MNPVLSPPAGAMLAASPALEVAPPAAASPSSWPERGYEVVNGHVVELTEMGAYEVLLSAALSRIMGNWAHERRLGWVVSEMLFALSASPPLHRRPDVAFLTYGRWPEALPARENAWRVAPDLAVEIVSPTNLAGETHKKAREYLAHGTRLVWVVYPETRDALAFHADGRVELITEDGAFDGGDALPGFRLPLRTLYASLEKPTAAQPAE